MIIDGHAHSAGPFFQAETLIAKLEELGVDKVILCQNIRNNGKEVWVPFENREIGSSSWPAYLSNKFLRFSAWLMNANRHLKERNEFVRTLAGQCPDRVIPFYWLNPRDPNALADAEIALSRDGFRGIKLHQCVQRFSCGDPVLDELAVLAARKSVPIFIHLYSRAEARKFLDWARRHLDTNFIIAHLIGMEILGPHAAETPNIHIDISPAYGSKKEWVRTAISTFGADRIIFGSDTPFGRNGLARNLVKIRSLNLDAGEEAQILGGNMAHLLGLE
jgi:uncharacterized protein